MTVTAPARNARTLLSPALRLFLELQNVLRGMSGLDTDDLSALTDKLTAQAGAESRDMGLTDVFYAVWDATYEKFAEQDMWLFDLYYDEAGQLFAILNGTGKLFRVNVTVKDNQVSLGEAVQVKLDFPEVEQGRSERQVLISRQADGKVRWTVIASVAILNRSGELDARSLFDSIIRHREDGKDYPYATIAHAGKKFRVGQADFMLRDGYCLIESGLFDDSDLAGALIADLEADADWWGTSISFWPLTQERMQVGDISIPVYTEGWQEEISFLKETSAASFMTGASVITQERNQMTKTLEEALLKLGLSAEDAKAQSERSDERNRAISDSAVIKRQSTLAAAEETQAAAPEAVASAAADVSAEPDPFADPAAVPAPAAEVTPPVEPAPAEPEDPAEKRIAELEAAVAVMQQSITEGFKSMTEALMQTLAEQASATAQANRSMSEAANERMEFIEAEMKKRARNIDLDVPRRGDFKLGQPAGAGKPAAGISRPSERQQQQGTGPSLSMTPNAERLAALERMAN